MTATTRHLEGFVPTFLLMQIAQRNADMPHILRALPATHALWSRSPARQNQLFRFMSQGNGDRFVYDAQEQESDGNLVRKEGDPAAGNADADKCYDIHGIIRDYYKQVHNCNSIDGNGMALIGTVNYGKHYCNAFWNSARMTYGKGDGILFKSFVDLNVGGHEVSHGRTEHAVPGGIEYWGMAGLENESYSDKSTASIESWHLKLSAKKYHFLIGKDLWMPVPAGETGFLTALRNMRNPGTAFNYRRVGKDPQPAHMSNYVRTRSDQGGVHINSGIPNRQFALFSDAIEDAGMGDDWESTIGRAFKIVYAARPNVGNRPSIASVAYWEKEACAIFGTKEEDKLRKIYQECCDQVGIVPDKNGTDDLTPDMVSDEEIAA